MVYHSAARQCVGGTPARRRAQQSPSLEGLPDCVLLRIFRVALAQDSRSAIACARASRHLWGTWKQRMWPAVIIKALQLGPAWASAGEAALRRQLHRRWCAVDKLITMLPEAALEPGILAAICGCVGAHHMFSFLMGEPASAPDGREADLLIEALRSKH
jgi:hypothetical protein